MDCIGAGNNVGGDSSRAWVQEQNRPLVSATLGSQKYHGMWGEGKAKSDIDVKLGGIQIEHEDEDPIVPQMFQEACVKAGIKNLMLNKK